MDEWYGESLEDHREVVGVAQETIGTIDDRRKVWNNDDPYVPAFAERCDGPVAKSLREDRYGEHRYRETSHERPFESEDLERTGKQEHRMQELHGAEVPLTILDAAALECPARVTTTQEELEDSFGGE